MTPQPATRSDRHRQRALFIGGYACLCLAYLVWVWSNDVSDLGGDSAMYMLIARHLSPFYADSPVLSAAVQGTTYPPLYPLLIGLFGGSMLAGHLLAAAALLAAVLCLRTWLIDEGLGPMLATWTAALFALMPGTYFLTLNIWTENPYLLFSLIAILSENRAGAADHPRPGLRWVAAAAVAAATLTRTAALPLLAAFVLRLLIVRPRRWFWLLAASAAPFLAWAAWGMLHRSGVSGYLAQWSGAYGNDPLKAMLAQVKEESYLAAMSWVRAWLGQDMVRTPVLYLLAAIGGTCLLGWLRRLAELRFDAIYVPLYAGLLLLWPFPAEAMRLSYVLIPVLLAQGVLLLRPRGSKPGTHLFPVLLLGALGITALPTLLVTVQRFVQPLPAGLTPARHIQEYYVDDRRLALFSAEGFTGTLKGLRDAGPVVPESDCIFSTKPSLVALYASRISFAPLPDSAPDEAFERDIGRCRYAYLRAATSPSYSEPLYPRDRLGVRVRPLYAITNSEGFVFTALIEIQKR